jgi:CHAT domain-containing protein
MPSLGKGLTVCLCVLIGVYVLQSRNSSSHPPSPPSPVLLEGQSKARVKQVPFFRDFGLRDRNPISRRLTKGAVHRYSVTLEKGSFLHAWVDQDSVKGQEIDIALRLYGPKGQPLFEIDSPTGEFGSEEIFLLADIPGIYRADIDGSGKEGVYRIRVQTIRPATAVDRTNAQAALRFFHAREITREDPPKVDQAVREYLEAEGLWRVVGNKRWQAHALHRVGNLLVDSGNLERILDLQTRALNLFRAIGDRRWTAKMLVAVGATQRKLDKLHQAESSYRQALEISKDHGYADETAEALMNLGLLLDQKGDHWSALESCGEALKIWQERERIDNQVVTLSCMGITYSSLGKPNAALDKFLEAEPLLALYPSAKLEAQVWTRLSEMYGRKKEKDHVESALAYARRALTLRKKARDLRGEAVSLSSIGLLYRAKNDLARARDAQEQALRVFRELSDVRGESTALYNIGLVLIDQKDPALALEHFEQAATLAQRQGFPEGQVTALYGKALAHEARGNPIAARAAAEEALKLINSGIKVTASDGFESPYVVAQIGTHELLMDLLITSPASYTSEADKARAFEVSEGARWRVLLDKLSGEGRSRLLRQPNPTLRAEYDRIRVELETAEQERKRLDSRDEPTDAISATIAGLIERLDILEVQLRRVEEGDPNRSAPVSLKEAQALLDANTILLEYFLGDRRSFLFLVTPTTIKVFELPKRVVIETKAEQLYKRLKRSHLPEDRKKAARLARDLSSMLVEPVAAYLEAKRILVVPDGAIHYVPFAVLPEPLRGPATSVERSIRWEPFLLERHEIVYEPSASVLKAIRSERSYRRPPSGFLAVMAGAMFSDDYDFLKHSLEEAEEILDLVPKQEKTLGVFGYEANLDLALSGVLGDFRYVHFATHGYNHPEQPALSGIVLSLVDRLGRRRPGDLRLQDIKRLDLPAELVVLSACQTAIGLQVQGEGFVALPQGFMQAGAARVVVSLWNVRDQSTARLMERFYRALLIEKQSPSQALRTAQLWMLREPKWKSPYFWAAFELQGEWR